MKKFRMDEVFTYEEMDVITEAITDLRKVKLEAFGTLKAFDPRLTERDFGIPTIDSLLARFDEFV